MTNRTSIERNCHLEVTHVNNSSTTHHNDRRYTRRLLAYLLILNTKSDVEMSVHHSLSVTSLTDSDSRICIREYVRTLFGTGACTYTFQYENAHEQPKEKDWERCNVIVFTSSFEASRVKMNMVIDWTL